jgi:hypothetical protein
VILHVARRELLGHLRAPRFLVLCALALALLGTGGWVSARRYAARAGYADALEALRQTAIALERPDDDPSTRFGWRAGRVAADPALRAVRPPWPAAVFAAGHEWTMPSFWQAGTEGLVPGAAADDDAPGAIGAEPLDLEYIVRAVLSLLALLLAADTLAGERETGVLRTLFAAPVSRLDVLLGKYVGAMLTLVVPLALGTLLSGVVLAACGVPVVDGEIAARVALLFAGSLAYLAAVFALGAVVSACCREARTATVVLMAVWVALVLVAPNAAALGARVARPVTPDELFRQDRATGIRQLEAERARVLAAVWRGVTGSDATPTAGAIASDVRRRYDDARARPDAALMQRKRAFLRTLDDGRAREQRARDRLAATLGLLSPAATFAAFAAEAVGTGDAFRERWERAARDHQQRLERAVFDRAFGTELFDARANFLRITYRPNQSDPRERVPRYAELPAFAPPSADPGADVRAALPLLALLALHGVVCLAASAVAVGRMEV